jgi:Tat protein secretion system quality control protein TatD with DNase activity
LFDSHHHLQSGKFGLPVDVLIGQMRDAGVTGCVVNATREEDWEAVRALAQDFPDFVRGLWHTSVVCEYSQSRLAGSAERNPNP